MQYSSAIQPWKQIVVMGSALTLLACGGSDKRVDSPGVDDDEHIVQDDEPPTRHHSSVPDLDDDDDESGDGVDIQGLKGHLDPYDIQEAVAPHSVALATCFKQKAKSEHYLGGEVLLSFTVARDGSVKSVQNTRSSVGSWEVENCLIEESKTIAFKKPKGGEADFTLPLDFDARRPANWWTEAKADEEIADRPAELRKCRQETKTKDPKNVWVTLYLGNRGVVKSVGFASPHKRGIDPLWAQCAAGKISAWTLNDPRGKVAKLGFRYNPE
jgi:TonB family protein